MARLFPAVFLTALLAARASVQTWEELGGSASAGGISIVGNANGPSVALDDAGFPVVAWSDGGFGSGRPFEIYLRRWDGTEWKELGGSASGGGISNSGSMAYQAAVALNAAGEPCVAWTDVNHVHLRRWNGSSWEELGGSATGGGISGASPGRTPSLVLDSGGLPALAWVDDPGAPGQSVHFRRWTGSTWEELGGSATGTGVGITYEHCSLALDTTGKPAIVWNNRFPGSTATAVYFRRWTGSGWVELGGSATGDGIAATGGSNGVAVALDKDGKPTVTWYGDDTNDAPVYVRRWTGTTWESLGESGSDGGIGRCEAFGPPELALDMTGKPFVAWPAKLDDESHAVYLRRWTGTSWEGLGGSAEGRGIGADVVPISFIAGISLALDKAGLPTVAWADDHSYYPRYADLYLKRFVPSTITPLPTPTPILTPPAGGGGGGIGCEVSAFSPAWTPAAMAIAAICLSRRQAKGRQVLD